MSGLSPSLWKATPSRTLVATSGRVVDGGKRPLQDQRSHLTHRLQLSLPLARDVAAVPSAALPELFTRSPRASSPPTYVPELRTTSLRFNLLSSHRQARVD